jgi:hypothetical protein
VTIHYHGTPVTPGLVMWHGVAVLSLCISPIRHLMLPLRHIQALYNLGAGAGKGA